MGDRCSLEITIRHSDEAKAAECGIERWQPSHDHEHENDDSGDPLHGRELLADPQCCTQDWLIEIEFDEANYGMQEERENLAKMGVPFYGSHGSGGNYPGYYFAALDGVMLEVPLLAGDGGYVVRCDWKTGDPLPEDIENLKAYMPLVGKVEELFAPLRKEEED